MQGGVRSLWARSRIACEAHPACATTGLFKTFWFRAWTMLTHGGVQRYPAPRWRGPAERDGKILRKPERLIRLSGEATNE